MNSIVLHRINIDKHKISYDFSFPKELQEYFTGNPFVIKYPQSIENTPKSVLSIPFVCNVLPIIWLTNTVLEIEELDKAFYESIFDFKQGYEKMYPNIEFKGEIRVNKIVNNAFPNTGNTAMFYSGGLDSAFTLVSHLDERPILISMEVSSFRNFRYSEKI